MHRPPLDACFMPSCGTLVIGIRAAYAEVDIVTSKLGASKVLGMGMRRRNCRGTEDTWSDDEAVVYAKAVVYASCQVLKGLRGVKVAESYSAVDSHVEADTRQTSA